MQIGSTYIIDFAKISTTPKFYINIKNGDRKREIKLILLDNGKPLNLNNYKVIFTAKKPDGNDILNDVVILDAMEGLCEVEISTQMVVLNTDLNCEIVLYKSDGTVASSSDFVLNILPTFKDSINVVSSSEFTALSNALIKILEWDKYFEETSGQIEQKYTEKLNTLVSKVNNIVQSRFSSKKYVAIGDSITVGFVDKPYATLVAETMNMTVVNMGVSGSAIAVSNDKSDSMYERRESIPEDASVISIFGGTNDFGHNSSMGASGSTSFYDFYGAFRMLIEWIQENRPNAVLFVITPLHREGDKNENAQGYTLEDYVNVIRDVCEDASVPVLDLFRCGELNPNIAKQKELFTSDGLHPLQPIHTILGSYKIPQFIRGL